MVSIVRVRLLGRSEDRRVSRPGGHGPGLAVIGDVGALFREAPTREDGVRFGLVAGSLLENGSDLSRTSRGYFLAGVTVRTMVAVRSFGGSGMDRFSFRSLVMNSEFLNSSRQPEQMSM